jgi:sec-independent protein translocase protein TatA
MTPKIAFMNIGPAELIVVALLALLIFGKRLPEVGRNLGKGIVEFKKGLAGADEESDKAAAAKQIENKSAPALTAEDKLKAAQEELRAANEKIRVLEQKTSH